MSGEITIRPGREADGRACNDLLWASISDFGARNGTPLPGSAESWWASGQSLHRYLALHAAEWWVAEDPGSGELVGYARSIERDDLFELTEFFVRPGHQSRGVGRTLLERAFPLGRGKVRSIIATRDVRALARYYGAGTAALFPIISLGRAPAPPESPSDLAADRLDSAVDEHRAAVREVERSLLGHARDEAGVRWLLEEREGFLYRRGGTIVGFGYIGKDGSGPIGALEPADLPDILLHIEGRASALGVEELSFEVPGPNEIAMRHLLGRGFRIEPWTNFLMANRPFGSFDRLICFGPPLFL